MHCGFYGTHIIGVASGFMWGFSIFPFQDSWGGGRTLSLAKDEVLQNLRSRAYFRKFAVSLVTDPGWLQSHLWAAISVPCQAKHIRIHKGPVLFSLVNEPCRHTHLKSTDTFPLRVQQVWLTRVSNQSSMLSDSPSFGLAPCRRSVINQGRGTTTNGQFAVYLYGRILGGGKLTVEEEPSCLEPGSSWCTGTFKAACPECGNSPVQTPQSFP